MSEKYVGVVYKGEPVLFPSPAAPSYGYGPKYCILVKDGSVYFLYKDGHSIESTSVTPLEVKRRIDRSEWAQFPNSPIGV